MRWEGELVGGNEMGKVNWWRESVDNQICSVAGVTHPCVKSAAVERWYTPCKALYKFCASDCI